MKHLKHEKKIKSGLTKIHLALFGLFIFGGVTVFLAIDSAGHGAELLGLEQKEVELREENEKLTQKLIDSSSITVLAGQTESRGFFKPKTVVYISNPELVASASYK